MNEYKEFITKSFKSLLTHLPDDVRGNEERLSLIAEVTENICDGCGRLLKPSEVCHCQNDE